MSTQLLPELIPMLGQISEVCPASAEHAGHMLSVLCRPWLEYRGVNGPAARHGAAGSRPAASLLTPAGYPLEFTFRTGSSELCYTAEPGLASDPVEAKWRVVRELVPDFDPMAHSLLRQLVPQSSQRFGCWLGVRHDGDGQAAFKIYQEVAPEARELVLAGLRSDLPGLDRIVELQPTLLGVVCSSGETEYYCNVHNVDQGILHNLFAAAGLARHLPSVTDYVAYLAAEPSGAVWDRLRVGISYGISASAPPDVTLFMHARELFPNNLMASIRILGLARHLGTEMPLYERITKDLETNEGHRLVHGFVGIKVTTSGRLECAVGVSPKDVKG
jgi:hypothetical protein